MKLKISRAILVAIIFATTTMVSVSFATIQAVNYSHYWDARTSLTSHVDKLHAQTDPANGNVTIQATVSATNPTDYSGLIVRYFELRLTFAKPVNQSLFAGDSSGEIIDVASNHNQPIGDPVGPHSTTTLTLSIPLSPARSAAFTSFGKPDPSKVYGETDVRAVVDSFLDYVIGPEVVQNVQTVPVT